jgi:hypothetical protein
MNYFKRRKLLRSISATDLIPIIVRAFTIEEEKVIVHIPKFESPIIHLLAPSTQKMFFNVKLDEMGTKCWESIDGRKTVSEIIKEMTGKDGANSPDLETRVNKFVSTLYENRFITFKQLIENE